MQEHARIREAGGDPCPGAGKQLKEDTRQNVSSWQMCGEAAGEQSTVDRRKKSTRDVIYPAHRLGEAHGACTAVGSGRHREQLDQVSISRSPVEKIGLRKKACHCCQDGPCIFLAIRFQQSLFASVLHQVWTVASESHEELFSCTCSPERWGTCLPEGSLSPWGAEPHCPWSSHGTILWHILHGFSDGCPTVPICSLTHASLTLLPFLGSFSPFLHFPHLQNKLLSLKSLFQDLLCRESS